MQVQLSSWLGSGFCRCYLPRIGKMSASYAYDHIRKQVDFFNNQSSEEKVNDVTKVSFYLHMGPGGKQRRIVLVQVPN